MNKQRILERENKIKRENSYFYIKFEKQNSEYVGETVEEFLARGGKIKKIEKTPKPGRDNKGKFLKKQKDENNKIY